MIDGFGDFLGIRPFSRARASHAIRVISFHQLAIGLLHFGRRGTGLHTQDLMGRTVKADPLQLERTLNFDLGLRKVAGRGRGLFSRRFPVRFAELEVRFRLLPPQPEVGEKKANRDLACQKKSLDITRARLLDELLEHTF